MKGIVWNDEMKLQLLKLYLTHAEDILIRDFGKTRRSAVRNQLKPIHATQSIILDGHMVKLDVLDIDIMAKELAYQGLSGQKSGEGLLNILDSWREEQEPGIHMRFRIEETCSMPSSSQTKPTENRKEPVEQVCRCNIL